jgi:hypothetical protein
VRLFHAHYPEWFVDRASDPTETAPAESSPRPGTKPRRPSSKGSKKGAVERAPHGSNEGPSQGSLLAQHNTTHHNTTEKTTTWLTPYLHDWKRQYDTEVSAPSKLTVYLKKVEDKIGPGECRTRWVRYLASCPVAKASAARFAETHTGYATAAVAGTSGSATSNGARRPSATDNVKC